MSTPPSTRQTAFEITVADARIPRRVSGSGPRLVLVHGTR